MKLLAVFALSRAALQRAIDLEASQGHSEVRRLELVDERAGKVSIHGADRAVMAVIGRLVAIGHDGLLCVRPATCQCAL